ncbi:segregation and condensation protein A [Myceligenerans pegani]|uniref:Segregation and condensation protein A n=1 Tax=Myceligenerans pegani TaxID=2776917 RepID=A0ABR9N6M2_9MICO|nr:segregation/condensation protein A [Myceligenerans sp. TRM 65318]MBE3021207.1 segregation/condensation protein A [Myceligenerans sp. TRM 65318]
MATPPEVLEAPGDIVSDGDPASSDDVVPEVAGAQDDGPAPRRTAGGFEVHLDNFTGPFDLLLSLITKREMDVTEVALAAVTDEFVAHIRAAEEAAREAADRGDDHPSWDLGVASEFLVVAATLLDIKAARLLPGVVEEELEDLELLEARDLLFARLLQYRAYKEVSALLAERMATAGRRVPRLAPLEPHLTALLPELAWTVDGPRLAALAAKALQPKPPPEVSLTHLHAPAVSVREEAGTIVRRLRAEHVVTFRALTAGVERMVVVARFLALLELFRDRLVSFEQVTSLGELTVRWAAGPGDGGKYLDPDAGPSEFDEDDPPPDAAGASDDDTTAIREEEA